MYIECICKYNIYVSLYIEREIIFVFFKHTICISIAVTAIEIQIVCLNSHEPISF